MGVMHFQVLQVGKLPDFSQVINMIVVGDDQQLQVREEAEEAQVCEGVMSHIQGFQAGNILQQFQI